MAPLGAGLTAATAAGFGTKALIDRQEKKNKVIDKLLEFFDKFFSISSNKM